VLKRRVLMARIAAKLREFGSAMAQKLQDAWA
jgi:hypothetical protein